MITRKSSRSRSFSRYFGHGLALHACTFHQRSSRAPYRLNNNVMLFWFILGGILGWFWRILWRQILRQWRPPWFDSWVHTGWLHYERLSVLLWPDRISRHKVWLVPTEGRLWRRLPWRVYRCFLGCCFCIRKFNTDYGDRWIAHDVFDHH